MVPPLFYPGSIAQEQQCCQAGPKQRTIFRVFSPVFAPKGIEPRLFREFTIQLIYSLAGCYRSNNKALSKLPAAGTAKGYLSEHGLANFSLIEYSY
jgi:hypothetical protein